MKELPDTFIIYLDTIIKSIVTTNVEPDYNTIKADYNEKFYAVPRGMISDDGSLVPVRLEETGYYTGKTIYVTLEEILGIMNRNIDVEFDSNNNTSNINSKDFFLKLLKLCVDYNKKYDNIMKSDLPKNKKELYMKNVNKMIFAEMILRKKLSLEKPDSNHNKFKMHEKIKAAFMDELSKSDDVGRWNEADREFYKLDADYADYLNEKHNILNNIPEYVEYMNDEFNPIGYEKKEKEEYRDN